jgi:hypothetical protein
MAAIDMRHAIYMPTEEELTRLLSVVCGDGGLWKLGSCYKDQLGSRPFDAVHYNNEWFERTPVCVALGIDSKALAALLETAGIRHLKRMGVGVNVKNSDDVPHDGISAARTQALYVVPVKRTITTVQQFKDEHKSYYKQTHGGAGLKAQRVALGLPPNKPQDPTTRKEQDPTTRKERDPTTRKERDPAKTSRLHDGGEQPKKHLDDTKFVSGLINSGIPLDIMDPAFAGTSPFRINKMFALFWEVPEVGPNLKRLSGKNMAYSKFKRIKPIYERARKG